MTLSPAVASAAATGLPVSPPAAAKAPAASAAPRQSLPLAPPPAPPGDAAAPALADAPLPALLLSCLGTARRHRQAMSLLWIEIGLPSVPLETADQARVLEDLLLRVRRRIRPTDHARVGGAQALAVVLMGADEAVAQKVAQRLARVLHQPHGLGLRRLPLSARIGVASPPDRGGTSEGLLAAARASLAA